MYAAQTAQHTDTGVLEVKQGGLGDCWLIGAFACLADFPGHVAWILLNLKAKPWGGGKMWEV